ncbi:hypothetical protein [Paenibacillus sp. 481]|uniref:hypothetical protein n=1 Tax=Paenibacillus sp. 481 TaxID=2835869 RepID=UPI001E56073D|nr:hypothetical protein [Paenibacillus sp. 481]UHA72670.1 hypothetical protein KIK04_18780 [Paenibacillus sp. 481]
MKIKKLFAAVSLSLLLSIAPSASAQGVHQQKVQNEQVVRSFLTTENGLQEITIDEYKALLKRGQVVQSQVDGLTKRANQNPSNDISADHPDNRPVKFRFYSSYFSAAVPQPEMRIAMTDILRNTSSVNDIEQEVNWSNEYGYNASAGFTSTYFQAMEIVFGAGWHNTKSVSYTTKVTAKPRTEVYLTFTPLYDVAVGDTVSYNRFDRELSRNSVSVKSPVQLAGGKTRGIVTIVEKRI